MTEKKVTVTINERQEDWDLVQKIQAGDTRAFERLYEKYVGKIFNNAMRFLRSEADAEELVQEVFLTVLDKSRSFRGDSAFSSWLYRVTANAAVSRIRKRKGVYEEEYIEEFLPKFSGDGHHLIRPVVDWAKNPEDQLMNSEIMKFFQESIEMLDPTDKFIVLMSDIEGMSNREIAETLDLTISAVKGRLHRSRLFLRGKLAVFLGHSPH